MSRIIASCAVVVLAAVTLVGCGGKGTEAVNAATVTRNAARLGDLHRRIMGNVAERTAGERLAYHGLQDPIQACAAAAGLPDLRPPFINLYAGRTDADLTVAFSGDGWFTPISTMTFGLADDQLRLAATQPAAGEMPVDRLSPADRDRYEKIQDSCEPPAAAYTGVQVPAGAADLNQVLDEVVAAVVARAPVKDLIDGYRGCLKEAGFPGLANPTALGKDLSGSLPPRDAMPVDGHPAAPEWTAFVARERRAARADAGCRRDIYAQGMTSIGPDLDRFESEHASDLVEVRRRWDALVTRAGRLSP